MPAKDEFFSILTNEGISEEQYNHAQQVWSTFGLKTMGDYYDLYLRSDILLLADVFENFRQTCLQYYKLDPALYFTSPGLSWSAMLKMTGMNDFPVIGDLFMRTGLWDRQGANIASRYKEMCGVELYLRLRYHPG